MTSQSNYIEYLEDKCIKLKESILEQAKKIISANRDIRELEIDLDACSEKQANTQDGTIEAMDRAIMELDEDITALERFIVAKGIKVTHEDVYKYGLPWSMSPESPENTSFNSKNLPF
jgi:hypothetical protein